ncbi:PCRF domain-containing protein, partial [Candidatus Dojkabacteria bacterium]|nr:PCRF domain-containing protein [Candidatus Dojkabacteria bacterium]
MSDQDGPTIDIVAKKQEREDLLQEIQRPEIMADYTKVGKLNEQLKELDELISTWEAYQDSQRKLAEAQSLSDDPELGELAKADIPGLETEIETLSAKLQALTAIKLPHDDNDAIMEIRAGTGGTEAALFAEEIVRMYIRFINSIGMVAEQIHTSLEDTGGIKEVILKVNGHGAYGKLRFESGVHRVQRVPVTEAKGRIHTSAISVVVLPQIEATEVNIPAGDIRVDVYRSSGPGGQSVNTTDSAVRITHLPTGLVVTCQDSKSQIRNREQALSVLASRLQAMQEEEDAKQAKDIRAASIQSGDRSAKIRTYNFP